MFLLVHSEASSLGAAGAHRLVKLTAFYLKIRQILVSLQLNKISIFHCINAKN